MGLSPRRARLQQAYRATHYRVVGLDLTLRADRRSAALDQWLRRHGIRCWVLLSAWNPHSCRFSRKRNRVRQRAMLAVLAGLGRRGIPARNEPLRAAAMWTEESVFVPGLSLARGRSLARRFGQAALLAGRLAGPARLVFV